MRINKHDTNGVKPLLDKGELGYDDYAAGGDAGRAYVGTGTENVALAKKSEVDSKVDKNTAIVSATKTKITYDTKGLVIAGADLIATDIPVLDTSKITTGTLPVVRGGTGVTTSTGTGSVVLNASPTLVTPNIGVASGTSFNSITGLSSTATDIKINGTQAAGTLATVARADHVHPIDTSRAASTHTHGNISNTGAIGTTENLPIITGTSGVLRAGAFGTTAGTFCQGNDSRLATNLAIGTRTTTTVPVTSSTGANVDLPAATTSLAGVMSSVDKTKLDGIAANANNYTHPTSDGNLHVPATGTTNNGKVLTAGATAGSLSWQPIPSAQVTSVAGKTGAVTLVKGDVGLDNVDNTTDSAKNVLSATKLTTARTINGVNFDGTSNIELHSRLGNSISSASTTNIGEAGTKETVRITGTTTINSFGTSTTGVIRTLIFDNILTINSSANIIFPSNVNITTEPNNIFTFLCENGATGVWRCINTMPSRIW